MRQFYEYQNKGQEEELMLPASNDSNNEAPKHFDAIILDLNMPIMDGFEACKQII